MLQLPDAPLPDETAVSMSEIDHRIANNLALIASLVRIRASSAADTAMTGAEAAALLGETADQIDAVARLHRLLAHTPGAAAVSFAAFLGAVCTALSATIAKAARMTLTCAFKGDAHLAHERALPIALIVCEVVANAAKYAHPAGVGGAVRLHCTAARGGVRIEIEDDGVGLPQGFDPTVDGGLGFRVIRTLTRQIGAKSAFSSRGLGLRFVLDAP